MKKSQSDILIALVLFIVLTAFAFQMGSVPDEARAYPQAILIVSYLITAALLIINIKKGKSEEKPGLDQDFKNRLGTIAGYILIMGLYVFLIDKISYIASTLLFVFISLRYLKVTSWKVLILLPLCLTFTVYFAFTRFLMVSLPEGTWFYIIL